MQNGQTTGLLIQSSSFNDPGQSRSGRSFWQRLAAFAQARERTRRHRMIQAQLAALNERLLCDIGCDYLEKGADRAPRYRPLPAPVLHIRPE